MWKKTSNKTKESNDILYILLFHKNYEGGSKSSAPARDKRVFLIINS